MRNTWKVLVSEVSLEGCDRVVERRRAVALARHFREAEGLSSAQIAARLGRSPATVKAYFYDPTGEKARAVKARYVGLCRGCGAYTQPRNGKGGAYAYCRACHPGAIERRWTPELLLGAMIDWQRRFGCLPTPYGWSATHARGVGERGVERLGRSARCGECCFTAPRHVSLHTQPLRSAMAGSCSGGVSPATRLIGSKSMRSGGKRPSGFTDRVALCAPARGKGPLRSDVRSVTRWPCSKGSR